MNFHGFSILSTVDSPHLTPPPALVYHAAMTSDPARRMTQALRDGGVRVTRQRAALLKVLTEAADHPDAAELHRPPWSTMRP